MLKRKIIKILLSIILITAGLLFFVYPRITDKLYKNNVSELVTNYDSVIEELNNSKNNYKLAELYDILKEENNKIYLDGEKRFLTDNPTALTDIKLSDYGLEDNIFGFIEIPSINITLPIYFGSSEANMRLGATHLTGTSYPIGGVNTNSVIAAHRGYYRTEMFRHIDKIQIGDKLVITNPYEKLTYIAYKTVIIKPSELDKLTIKEGEDMITLISCHPFPNNTERYVVYFKREK